MLFRCSVHISTGSPFVDRLLAATRTEGTCSFLVFLSDFCGYVVSVFLLLHRDFGSNLDESPTSKVEESPLKYKGELDFFLRIVWACEGAVVLLLIIATFYFSLWLPIHPSAHEMQVTRKHGDGGDVTANSSPVSDISDAK